MRYVESLNLGLHRVMGEDGRVLLIGEDLLDPYGGAFKVSRGLSTAFPDRVITTPISEGGIVGLSIGLAMRGFRPVVELMFGDFITLATDQIVNHASKFRWMYDDQVQVPLVIRTPMGGRRGYGPTHSQTLEAMYMTVTGLRIVAPSHVHDPGGLLGEAIREDGPVLFIENKLLYGQQVLEQDTFGRAGEFHAEALSFADKAYPTMRLTLCPGERPDVTLIAYGGMAPTAIEAARNAFLEEETKVEVLIPSLLRPVPILDFLPSVRQSGRVVVAEEGNRTGGWGAEVSSQVHELAFHALARPVERLGASDTPIPCSRPLEEEVLVQVRDVERAISKVLEG